MSLCYWIFMQNVSATENSTLLHTLAKTDDLRLRTDCCWRMECLCPKQPRLEKESITSSRDPFKGAKGGNIKDDDLIPCFIGQLRRAVSHSVIMWSTHLLLFNTPQRTFLVSFIRSSNAHCYFSIHEEYLTTVHAK